MDAIDKAIGTGRRRKDINVGKRRRLSVQRGREEDDWNKAEYRGIGDR